MTAPDATAAPINFALYLAGEGMRILPIPFKSKRPILNDWPNAATTDPDQICRWFDDGVAGNYGILCDGLVGVDIDPRREQRPHGGGIAPPHRVDQRHVCPGGPEAASRQAKTGHQYRHRRHKSHSHH